MTRCSSIAACAMAALLLCCGVSHATLGGKPSTPASGTPDRPVLRGAAQASVAAAPYIVHRTRTDDGVTVCEYTSSSNGVVFAVTWSGPVRPDMTALLGSYFPNFVSAARQGARGTGPLVERRGDLQIESIGHQGWFVGKAWVPRLLPAQVDPGELE